MPLRPPPPFVSRLERFGAVDSTQRIVRDWLAAGTPEVCLAVADHQSQGRGRHDRSWQAPPGRGLLVSVGFRPPDLEAVHAWRVPAIASLAMVRAANGLLEPTEDRLALKWPNDLVAVHDGRVRKVGGLLTESASSGEQVEQVIVGLGINVDWPASEFPPELADSMWSVSEAASGRRIDRAVLLEAWLEALGPLVESLWSGRFDGPAWAAAQVTTGSSVDVETGSGTFSGVAVGVDEASGALLVRVGPGGQTRSIAHGEVVRCRVDDADGHL